MASPGQLLAFFFGACILNALQRVLEAPGLDFGSILKGLGGVWGGFWEGFLESLEEMFDDFGRFCGTNFDLKV